MASEPFNVGDRVMRSDVTPTSIPAYRAMRGTVVKVYPSGTALDVAWDDDRHCPQPISSCPASYVTLAKDL